MKSIIILTLILTTISVNVFGLHNKKNVSTFKTNVKPLIDGVLNEEIWNTCENAQDFIQLNPNNGQFATFRTIAKFVYDDEALYIGVTMYDNSPDSIYTQLTNRDEINQCDFFGIYIDPFNSGLYAYGFFITAAGVQIDMKADGDFEDTSWDAIWESEVYITNEGWNVEIKIPFSALRFPKADSQVWGINLFRNVQRVREKSTWNFIDKEIEGFINQAGELTGISNIEPPLRLSFTPYLSGYLEHYSETNTWSRSIKGGLDLKYGINESFTLDMMLIPDFGQVQSDDEVLNLTPFETYYSENRQFFTEGTELFNKGDIFYSRRIGNTPVGFYNADSNLNENEKIISNTSENQVLNASKITGRTKSGTGIGFLNAMTLKSEAIIKDTISNSTRDIITQPFTNYNVFVIDQSLKNTSYISLINTNVSRFKDEYFANVTAADIKLVNKSKTYSINAIGSASQIFEKDFDNSNGYKYNLVFSKISGNFLFSLEHYLETDKFNPNDLGYLDMNNSVGANLEMAYNIYNQFGNILWMYNNSRLTYEEIYNPRAYSKLEFGLSSYTTFTNYLTAGFEIYSSLKNEHNYYETRVPGRFYKVPKWLSTQIYVSTDYRKKFAFDVWVGYWDADQINYAGFWCGFSPRLRIGDKFFILHNISYSSEQNSGYVDNYSDTEIYFGSRFQDVINNSLTTTYIFNNKQGISFRARHYWSKADYVEIYLLDENGEFEITNNYTENPDINYNIFNIDLIYSWNFAPGSKISVVWKNLINNFDDIIENSYFSNLDNTFKSPQVNNFSVKILYYLDYNYIKNSISKKGF